MINKLQRYNVHKVHLILTIILVTLIPSGIYNLEGLFIALLFCNWVFGLKGYTRLKKINKPTLILTIFFGLYVFGLLYTNNFEVQIKAITKYSAFILIPFSFVGVTFSNKQVITIKKYFIYSTLFSLSIAYAYAAYSYLETGKSTIYITDSVYSKFSYYGLTRVFENWHPTYVSFFCCTSLMFTYQLYFKTALFFKGVLISAFLITSVILLNSFIGIIVLGVLGIIFFLVLIKSTRMVIGVLFIFFTLLYLTYHFNPFSFSKLQQFKRTGIVISDNENQRNTLSLRLAIWEASYKVFKKAPIFGVTHGNYKEDMVVAYEKENYTYAARERYASHNQYLYILASFGIFGTIIFLYMIFYPLSYGGAVALFFVIFNIFCLTEDMLLRQQGIVSFVFFYTLLQIKDRVDEK